MIGRLCTLATIAGLALGAGPRQRTPHAAGPLLERVADIPLPGPAVRFDYQSADTAANRLYISHMNAGELVVFDVEGRKVVGTVGDLPRVTGVWSVPALGKIYASVPGHHHVAVIDARTLRVEARVGEIGFPDGIAYAPEEKKVYVSDESGGGELVIDGASNQIVTTIPLGGGAGNTIYDPGSQHILVAVQTEKEVVEIDPKLDRVVARHELAGASHPHGLAVDAARRLLFVANEGNATLQTVDLRTMKVVGRQSVGEDPDVLPSILSGNGSMSERNQASSPCSPNRTASSFATAASPWPTPTPSPSIRERIWCISRSKTSTDVLCFGSWPPGGRDRGRRHGRLPGPLSEFSRTLVERQRDCKEIK